MNLKRTLLSVLNAVVITALLAGVMLLVAMDSDGGEADLSYSTLDYDVAVQQNGDLKVTQHIDMKLNSRSKAWRQLYQRYTLKRSNLTNITDISVTNATNGERYTQGDFVLPDDATDWDSRNAGQWYVVDVTDEDDPQPFDPATDGLSLTQGQTQKTLEIGWNIPATDEAESLKFDISMTLQGVSTAYDDVVSFQWEPFGQSNQTPIGRFTGTITFPDGVNESNSWAWLHCENTSTTQRGTDGSLVFTADDVRSGDYLDVVAMFDASKAKDVARTEQGDHKQTLMDEETSQESAWRKSQHTQAVKRVAVWAVVAIAGLALSVTAVYRAVVAFRKSRYKGDIEYWRDLPEISPAAAAKLIDKVSDGPWISFGGGKNSLDNRQMSSTFMSLASKGAIAIYPGPAELYKGFDLSNADLSVLASTVTSNAKASVLRKTSTVAILPAAYDDVESLMLCQSEKAVLNILLKASQRLKKSRVFDLDMMNEAFDGYKSGYKLVEKFDKACTKEYDSLKATEIVFGSYVFAILGLLLALGAGVMFSNGQIALIPCICMPIMLLCSFALAYAKDFELTESGQKYGGQVLGLKNYLLDFSDFKDRGVLDMRLWGRYMVYATAFGISDKAMRQLAKAYPEVADPQWLDEYAVPSYLYWSCRSSSLTGSSAGFSGGSVPSFSANYGDLGAQLNSSFSDIRSTISAAAPSSSRSSSGGSFSGGGGFGGSSGGSGGGSFGGR